MTDSHKQLQIADLDLPPKRGRPPSGNALSNAEKQRAYRLRLKDKPAPKSASSADHVREIHDCYGRALDDLHLQIRSLREQLERASTGWPAVQDQISETSRQANVWKLKCDQLERIIRRAGLDLPPSWNTDTEFVTETSRKERDASS